MIGITRVAAAAAVALTVMAGQAARAADADIVDVAVAAGDFKTLAAALKAAGFSRLSRPQQIGREQVP